MNTDRDFRFFGQAAKAFGGQMDVERHGYPSDDAPLRVEPIAQVQFKAVTPDVEAGVQRLEHDCELQDLPVLTRKHMDFEALGALQAAVLRFEGHVRHMPVAEFDQRCNEELAKS